MMDIIKALGVFLFIVILFVGVPSAWIMSEFYNKRWFRILLGMTTLVLYVFCSAFAYSLIVQLQYNNDYGLATENLIKTSIQQIEAGNLDRVLEVWRNLDFQYNPTYESRAGYEELAEKATQLMKNEPTKPDRTGISSR